MASNRTTQAALTIALSLFVMLTFALAVTTYLFFSKRQEADTAQQAAAASAAEAQAAMQATKDEMVTLRGIIGVADDMPIADVETGLAKLFERHWRVGGVEFDIEEFAHPRLDRLGQPARHDDLQLGT